VKETSDKKSVITVFVLYSVPRNEISVSLVSLDLTPAFPKKLTKKNNEKMEEQEMSSHDT
jgi:hypothetical protein